MTELPVIAQLNIIVADMERSLAFYRRFGWDIDAGGGFHASTRLPNGLRVDFDTTEFAAHWDASYAGATGGSTVFTIDLPSRDGVDARYAELTGAGYDGRQPPYDAFWGCRYAIVADPDGNPVGLTSPRDPTKGGPPPL